MIEHALGYARQGWPIIPCNEKPGPEAKAPYHSKPDLEHGFKDASTDPQQVADWWIRWPDALIGGVVPPNRVVIDIDPRKGLGGVKELEALAGAPLISTLTVYSGREDGGCHLYYRRPPGILVSTQIKKVGADLKDAGKGYCILPPSLHPDTGHPYRWSADGVNSMSPELYKLIAYTPPMGKWTGYGVPDQAKFAGILRRVIEARSGERNNILYWAACRLTENNYPISAFQTLHAAGISAGLEAREVTKTISSANHALGGDL